MRIFMWAAMSLLSLIATAQQDAPVPVNQEPLHKSVFKNDYVEVLHVLIPAGQSTLFHTHSHDGVAVCLSEAQLKIHESGKEPTGPVPSHVGGVSANPYAEHPYTHRVNNVGTTDFEVLDIEILKRPEGPAVEPIGMLEAENPSARVYTYPLAPGASTSQHTHERPYLIISVTPMVLSMTAPDGKSMVHEVKAGDFHWVDSKVTHTLTNKGKENAIIVEVELK